MKKNKRFVILLIIVLLLIVIIYGIDFFSWHIVEIKQENNYNKGGTFNLDLDGDGIDERITLNTFGKYIQINNEDYEINKYFSDFSEASLLNSFRNCYEIIDLNNDGYLEIICSTYDVSISPICREYSIFNYKNSVLSKIGEMSIIGVMPKKVKVKGNTIKFDYQPYESNGMNETIKIELNIE